MDCSLQHRWEEVSRFNSASAYIRRFRPFKIHVHRFPCNAVNPGKTIHARSDVPFLRSPMRCFPSSLANFPCSAIFISHERLVHKKNRRGSLENSTSVAHRQRKGRFTSCHEPFGTWSIMGKGKYDKQETCMQISRDPRT
jgi:hypothetical protein